MVETFADFFNELMFGAGWPFGMILLIATLIILTVAWKYGLIISLPASLIFANSYLEHDLVWPAIIFVGFALFVLVSARKELKT